jgi:threonyl-tRNA synthetase
VGDALNAEGIRVRVDESDETVGEKIRRAITHKHPSVIVVGDDDVANTTVGLRLRGEDKEERGVVLGVAVEQLAAMAEPPR